MQVFINDDFVNDQQATLQVGDLAIQRGYAAFDFLRTVANKPLFMADYIKRFFNSAALMHLQHTYTAMQLEEIIHELINRNNLPESGIRMIMTGGFSPDSYEPTTPNLLIIQQPLILPSAQKFANGIHVISHEYQRDLPAVKSINYLMGIWLQHKVKTAGADDVLYHHQNIVSELPRANIFFIDADGVLVTNEAGILHGITRKYILQIASKNFDVQVREFTLPELLKAKEAFLCSTTKRILPIVKIDGQLIGTGKPGNKTSDLQQDLLALENAAIQQMQSC